MVRQSLSPSGENDTRRRPYWLVGGLILVVSAIVALAIYNLQSSRQAGLAPERGAEATAGEGVPVTAPTAPSFDVVRVSRGGTGVLAGRAKPGSAVAILVDGKEVSRTVADRNGEWVLILEQPLEAGTAELSLIAYPQEGDAVASEDVVVVSIPEPAPAERFVEPPEEGVVAVLSPKSGEGASRVMQKPGLAAPGEVGDSLAVDSVDFGAEGSTVFAGRSLPRMNVRIYLDNAFLGEVQADDEGRWVISTGEPLTPGEHRLRIDQVITDGDVRLRVVQPFQAGQDLDAARAENRVVVQPGNTLWAIARQLYGRGTRYTLIFQENSEQIVDPDLIYPGQRFKLPPRPAEETEETRQASDRPAN